MQAKDKFHNEVKNALIKDGWTITNDPFRLQWGTRDLYVDLGAEKMIAADKGDKKIAVEIKSFLGASIVRDFQQALGQYIMYDEIMAQTYPERTLYLAIRKVVFDELFNEPFGIGKLFTDNNRIRIIAFDPKLEEIVKWTP